MQWRPLAGTMPSSTNTVMSALNFARGNLTVFAHIWNNRMFGVCVCPPEEA